MASELGHFGKLDNALNVISAPLSAGGRTDVGSLLLYVRFYRTNCSRRVVHPMYCVHSIDSSQHMSHTPAETQPPVATFANVRSNANFYTTPINAGHCVSSTTEGDYIRTLVVLHVSFVLVR